MPGDPLAWVNLLPRAPEPMNANQMLALQLNQMKVDEAKRQQQGYNAFAQMFQNPNNLQNGMIKPEALTGAIGSGAIPPQMGMEMLGEITKLQQQNSAAAAAGAKVRDEHHNWLIDSVTVPAEAKYQEVLKQTGDPTAASQAAQDVYTEALTAAKQDGRLTPQESQTLLPNFDHSRAMAVIGGRKAMQNQQEQANEFTTHTDYGRNPPVEYRVYKDGRSTDLKGNNYTPTGIGESKGAEAQLFEGKSKDGKPVTVRMGPTGGWVDVESGDPVSIAGGLHKIGTKADEGADEEAARASAEKIFNYDAPPLGSYAMGRGNGPAIMKQIKELEKETGRTYDAKNYSAAKRLNDGYASTTPNSAGGQINAANTLVQHLDELQALATALQARGGPQDYPAINRVINYVRTQLGHPEATNLQTAAPLIADEVVKAAIGAGGGVSDREGMLRQLSDTRAPEQMTGGINVIKSLVGGRLNAMRRQWIATGLDPDHWPGKLEPETYEAFRPYLERGGKQTAGQQRTEAPASTPMPADQRGDRGATAQIPAAPTGSSQQAVPTQSIPKEALAHLKEGMETTFGNGQVWTLRNGQPARVR